MRVTLLEVVSAARLRVASLAAESAGYILLAVADQVAVAPRRVALSGVELGDDGKVRLLTGEPSSEPVAEAGLRGLLEQLLEAARSSTPALRRVARQVDLSGLAGLVRELEAALVPVNRAAAQRALARLARETTRAIERGLPLSDEPSRAEPPLMAALLVTPSPAVEPRRSPAAQPTLTLREVSSPPPPVTAKIAVEVPPTPSSPLDVPVLPEDEASFEVEVELEPAREEQRSPREAETRPEPVVRRSSAPPAPAAPTTPALTSPLETPRLGTLVAVAAAFREAPVEYELTERMPPVALVEDESVADLEAPVLEPAPSNEPAEAPELEAAPSDEPPEAPELEAAPSNEPAEAPVCEPEPLGEDDLIEEIPLESVLAVDHEPVEVAGALEEPPEVSIELAFTPSPHLPATLTLDEIRGPNYEPEPDYEPEPLPVYEPEPEPEPTPPSLPRVQLRREPLRSDIDDLLRGFRNETGPSEPELSRELRTLAGLDLTPPPTAAGER